MTPADTQELYELGLLALALWREARNQPYATKVIVACSMRNRVDHPAWWGGDWASVLTKFEQYSSMTATGDPNLVKWPLAADLAWRDCLDAAGDVHGLPNGTVMSDASMGATHYFDKSIDSKPPSWATDGSMMKVLDSGDFHFYRPAGAALSKGGA